MGRDFLVNLGLRYQTINWLLCPGPFTTSGSQNCRDDHRCWKMLPVVGSSPFIEWIG